ncbi:HNH endonuclease [Lutibacter sp. HS1-25]|uniref:HNH endonuclease n=1 Tax=Lutibacter sp. HS1-25 TaxID=2485000 RepID=UPI00101062C6|nr:HNH endonuclease [Lutibacter sp. HS1-25]RXP59482.1 HNH endonuclease [Lutibacter sp. HS1-25]
MIRDYKNEVWAPYANELWSDDDEYLVSNFGRIQRKKTFEDNWELSKTSLIGGYVTFWIRRKKSKSTSSYYVHRVVASVFCERPNNEKYVIHLDFDKENNKASNLKWVNKAEMFLHHKKNPKKIARIGQVTYSKLTEGRVRLIKKKIFDPNRKTRMRLIAKQFGISEMQLYRIKSGENWGHVKLED